MSAEPDKMRRRSRRAQRPATDGIPERDRGHAAERDPGEQASSEPEDTGAELSEQWWREQRPPHWS